MQYKTGTKTYELRKEGLAKLRYVLQEIAARRLKHKQGQWHCGTAHCVFGWVDVLEALPIMTFDEIKKLNMDEIENLDEAESSYDSCGTVVTLKGHKFHLQDNTVETWQKRYKFNLQNEEVEDILERIYDGEAKLKGQFKALIELEKLFLGAEQVVTENPFEVLSTDAAATTKQQQDYLTLMEALSEQKQESVVSEVSLTVSV